MFDQIVRLSIRSRWFILVAFLCIGALGVYNYFKLPIDAVPDITNVQVQINSEAQGLSPMEMESQVTYPIETALAGIPNLDYTRSVSRYGLSQVTAIFKEGTDIYFARQLVNEKLQGVTPTLPTGISTSMGPVSTGLGEIFMYTVENSKNNPNPMTPTELRTLQDWVIKPQLRNVEGVNEINTIGGYLKQFVVQPDYAYLRSIGLDQQDILEAISKNSSNKGSGYIEKNGEQYLIRSDSQISSIDQINNIPITTSKGYILRLSDVAKVSIGHELRTGAATKDGQEIVLGTAFMLIGENSRNVAHAVDQKLQEVQKSLPEGVEAKAVYNRTTLVDATIATVKKNLLEGAILVIVVLFVFLGHFRAALITAMVIPLSMLMTITGMVNQKISANLMSLGALDFGIIVDGAVVIVEASLAKLALKQKQFGRVLTRQERFATVFEATKESRKAILYGQLIIIMVYLPIMTLTGVEGKMFTPMAITVIMALLAAMILSITFVPAMIAMVTTGKVKDEESKIVHGIKKYYAPVLDWSLNHRYKLIAFVAIFFVFSASLSTRLGSEFIPSLDEGDVALHALRIPGTSLSQAIEMQYALEREIKKIPEVQTIFAKVGTAEIATDPVPPNVADNFVMLKPRDQWPNPDKEKAEIVAEIERVSKGVYGNNYEFTQPIQMRFNELISGVRTDVAVKISGDDLEQLLELGNGVAKILEGINGTADLKVEQISGLPMVSVELKRDMIANYGLDAEDVQKQVSSLITGQTAGKVFEGDRKFDIVVRMDENSVTDLEKLYQIPMNLPDGTSVLLSDLIELKNIQGPNQISRENGKRRIVVTANVRGTDIGSYIAEAQAKMDADFKLPEGYWMTWGGTFEQMQSASNRLMLVVPIALIIIFVMIYMALGNIRNSVLVFTGVPFALTGGVIALALRDIPLSISAAVGFIALSGVAVLNGLVLVSAIQRLINQGEGLVEAVKHGALERLRPVLITALVASLGFIPMALNVGIGSEVQRPIATVVIGGIISSTLLTLIILPTLYVWFNQKRRPKEPTQPIPYSE
ncbi:efflux RND transporter permease subunit [Acinetobacter variabilis]|uniref:efflux RND transporter permease subunit n=1 Tax=Acinetobacter variabilis TaxID=70346 RepID=UPI0028B1EEBE|nr:CusA/CzcA family heavy metal efflux RND transporter [Acinetobacter variabilis]